MARRTALTDDGRARLTYGNRRNIAVERALINKRMVCEATPGLAGHYRHRTRRRDETTPEGNGLASIRSRERVGRSRLLMSAHRFPIRKTSMPPCAIHDGFLLLPSVKMRAIVMNMRHRQFQERECTFKQKYELINGCITTRCNVVGAFDPSELYKL